MDCSLAVAPRSLAVVHLGLAAGLVTLRDADPGTTVVAGQAVEDVVEGVAGQDIRHGIAGGTDGGAAGQGEILHVHR